MKTLLFSTAVIAAAAITPALAQDTNVDVRVMSREPMTRAAVVQKVQDHFAKLDSNRDGFITKEEADSGGDAMRAERHERIEKRLAEKGIDMPDRGAVFDRLDANRDGSISREEFTSGKTEFNERRVIVIKDGDDAEGHRVVIKDGDKADGRRDVRIHRLGMRFGGHMFEMADADKDGRVSIQEATNAAATHFDKADSNHDGTLTREEMRAAHKGMHGKAGRR